MVRQLLLAMLLVVGLACSPAGLGAGMVAGVLVDESSSPVVGARVTVLEIDALESMLGGRTECTATWGDGGRRGLARDDWVDDLPVAMTGADGRFVLPCEQAAAAAKQASVGDLAWPALVAWAPGRAPRVVLLPTAQQIGGDIGAVVLPTAQPAPGRLVDADGRGVAGAQLVSRMTGFDAVAPEGLTHTDWGTHVAAGLLQAAGKVLMHWLVQRTSDDGSFTLPALGERGELAVWGDELPLV